MLERCFQSIIPWGKLKMFWCLMRQIGKFFMDKNIEKYSTINLISQSFVGIRFFERYIYFLVILSL